MGLLDPEILKSTQPNPRLKKLCKLKNIANFMEQLRPLADFDFTRQTVDYWRNEVTPREDFFINLFVCILFSFFSLLDLSYDNLCEKEPIGKELFRQFCRVNPKTKQLIDFLETSVSKWLVPAVCCFFILVFFSIAFLFFEYYLMICLINRWLQNWEILPLFLWDSKKKLF